jgi:osmotically-inducible protein OsmY
MGSQDQGTLALSVPLSLPTSLPDVSFSASPSHIREGAESRLRSNGYLAMKNVSCDYENGILTLRGCVPSYFLKQMAQTAVARMPGVERVINDIVVISSPRG